MPTWVQQFQDTFQRADTAPGTVGNGWVDSVGNTWSIASDLLHTSGGSGVLSNSGVSSFITERLVIAAKGQTWVGPYFEFILRANTGAGTGLLIAPSFNLQGIYWLIQNVATSAIIYNSGQKGTLPTTGHDLTFDLSVTGSSPTTFGLTITDNTAGNAVIYSDSYVWSVADTLQTQSGAFSILGNLAPTNIYSVTYYNGVSGVGQVNPTASTRTTISLTFTTGSASSGPYTRSLYRSTVSNFTAPDQGTLVSTLTGETGLSSSWVDTPPESPGGTVWYYQCVEVASDSSTITSFSAAGVLAYDPIPIGIIGDSISVMFVQSAWTTAIASYPFRSITVTNQAIAGTTSLDWEPTNANGYYTAAAAAFTTAGCAYTLIMLGMNDSGTNHGPRTPAQYIASIGKIVAAEVAAGRKVILEYPTYGCPGTAGTTYNENQTPDLLVAYGNLLSSLVDNVNVFMGDTQNYGESAMHASDWLDFSIHPFGGTGIPSIVGNWLANLMGVLGVTGPAPSPSGGGGSVFAPIGCGFIKGV